MRVTLVLPLPSESVGFFVKTMEKKFIVRAKDAGVFYGTIKERNGNEVTMTNARCLWYWDGAASLMQLAMEGVTAPQDHKLMTESEVENFKAILIERGYIDEGANIILGSGNNYKKSFDGFDLRLYINKRVGGYVVSSTMNIGEGVDAPRFTIADYDLDIDRIECAALKFYGCYCETINLDEGA